MALRIFETDPDSAPKPRQSYSKPEYAFQFRAGRVVGKRPVSLSAWRVTTPEPSVGDAIAQLYGGTAEEWETSKEDAIQVLTNAPAVQIIVDGSKSVDEKLILWGRNGPVHECDGEFFLSPVEEKGNPCGCPALLSDRKKKAQQGTGPAPNITLTFRLADDPDLGIGKFVSTAWSLATVLHEIKDALDAIDGEALCELRLELVEFTNAAGEEIKFRKPVIDVVGSYNDAIAS